MKIIKNHIKSIFLVLTFIACNEELDPPAFDFTSPKEKLLIREWTYDYILLGTDTVRALTFEGEPQTTGIFEALDQYYRRYDEDHIYEFRWEERSFSQREYGINDNYQPNLGYWHLSETEETLIHNKLTNYEKKFEILELTENSLKLKLVGDRTSFLTNGDGVVLDTITGSWVEVFVPKSTN